MADAADQQVHDDAVVSIVCIAHICLNYNLRRVTLKTSVTGTPVSEPLKSGMMRTQCRSVALLCNSRSVCCLILFAFVCAAHAGCNHSNTADPGVVLSIVNSALAL